MFLSTVPVLAHSPIHSRNQFQSDAGLDDDSYVRVEKFVTDVRSWSTGGPGDMIIHAAGWQRGSPNKSGKWKELRWTSAYPKFPSGAGHVVNRNLAAWVASHGDSLVEYQGEDTSVGIWLEQADFTAKFQKNKIFTSHGGDCFNPAKHVVGHNIPAAKMVRCSDHPACSHYRAGGSAWATAAAVVAA